MQLSSFGNCKNLAAFILLPLLVRKLAISGVFIVLFRRNFGTYEPRYETRLFAYAKTKTQISFAVTAKLISAFVFATRIVQSLYFLNPEFQASSHLVWLYSPVCVGTGWKPKTGFLTTRLILAHMQTSFTASTSIQLQ